MLPRVLPLANSLRTTVSRSSVLACNMSGHAHWKSDRDIDKETLSHMDYLPIPEGCWSSDFKRNQGKYNVQLLLSTSIAIVTGFAMYQTGCFNAWITPQKSCGK
ncbi:Hypothetical predicted protein [Octopus vulgaris]|nr:uncharacterized protein LOC115211961 [Octopus sinensis]CAI9722370.1 Hypothetical predicted protein [Octopus vulgaris]